MTLRVPYIADETIERDAEALLAQFAHARGLEIRAPIPIEDIVENFTSSSTTCTVCSGSRAVGSERSRTSLARSGWRLARLSLTKALIPRCGRRSRGVIALRSARRAAALGGSTDR